jgi:DNA-binding transcriptional regulator YiaG
MTTEALVTPAILVWTREKRRVSIVTAAKRAGIVSEELLRWETDTSQPTTSQARRLLRSTTTPSPSSTYPVHRRSG